jgi:hypothetical protein
MDWGKWHDEYDVPGSVLERRLRAVQERITLALDGYPPGPVRAISVCAGQGRDLLGVLRDHPRRADVDARLVELDPGNAAMAARTAAAAGLHRVETVVGDAALTEQYRGLVPADLVLMCGVFGNITDADVARTISHGPELCATGATLVWTRHREPPDLVPQICRWLEERDFERVWLTEPESDFGVGVHRFVGKPRPLSPGRMFTFVAPVP